MVILSDNADSLPISVYVTSTASPHHEAIILAEATLSKCFVSNEKPEHLIGDKAYDSDLLDERLAIDYAVELISSHRLRRKRPKTQDGRLLRRYKHRWNVEAVVCMVAEFPSYSSTI